MGYVPLPPPGGNRRLQPFRWPFQDRSRVREIPPVPGPYEVRWRVEPAGERWVWRVWFVLVGDGAGQTEEFRLKNGCGAIVAVVRADPTMIIYEASSWRHPGPYEVRGRCRDQGTADERAREAVDDARARWAAVQAGEMRRETMGHAERLPL